MTDYTLPRSVGLCVQIDTPSTNLSHPHTENDNPPLWKTLAMVRDEHSITAVSLLLNANPTQNVQENIRRAFRTKGIDVICFRPQHWNVIEPTCKTVGQKSLDDTGPASQAVTVPAGPEKSDKAVLMAYTLETYPMTLFEDLYHFYYFQQKHIFVQSLEADWQAHGIGCKGREEGMGTMWYGKSCRDVCEAGHLVEYPSSVGLSCATQCFDMEKVDRASYLLSVFNKRQAAAEAARAANPHAPLKVWHTIECNFFKTRPWQFFTVLEDVIPRMDSPPDRIGLSIYAMAGDPVAALEYAMRVTGLGVERFYIAECGSKEKLAGAQAAAIERVVKPLFEAGVRLAFVWSLEDATSYPTGYSVIDIDTGEILSGYGKIKELNEFYRKKDEK